MGYSEHRANDLYASRLLERMEATARARQVHLTEATVEQRVATGASGWGWDPVDQDLNYRRVGGGGPREVPWRTRERAITDSIAGYRANPMARAIIDTYVGFCVGDSGLSLSCSSDEVRPVAESFWNDPRNAMMSGRELMVRTWFLMGEQAQQMMVGEMTGVTRRAFLTPSRITAVELRDGNPLWPEAIRVRQSGVGDDARMSVAGLDDMSGLRQGEVFFWPGFRAVEDDTRGYPFLAPVLDWLDDYDRIISNLIDRTALARYLVWDVTVEGDGDDVQKFIDDRKGLTAPRSGSIEVHNQGVKWEAKTADTGSYEDSNTVSTVHTGAAAGVGLAKHWLGEPDNANRATSLTMAEPVRRRVGSVQNEWLSNLTEMARYAVDQAVAAGRIPMFVEVPDQSSGQTIRMLASDTVSVTGPQIAQADAKVTAEVIVNLSQSLTEMVSANVMSLDAAQLAAQKAWEDYMGVPFRPELAAPDAEPNDVATHVDANGGGRLPLAAVK